MSTIQSPGETAPTGNRAGVGEGSAPPEGPAARTRPGAIDRWLLNPAIKAMVRVGLTQGVYSLIETQGRVSGRRRTTPVGRGRDGDTVWIVAEHGEASAYVRNLIADPRVRIRFAFRWHRGIATVVPGDDGLTRRAAIDRSNGLMGRLDGRAFRAKATDPTTIRVDLSPRGGRRP